jgi:hypothetical protein
MTWKSGYLAALWPLLGKTILRNTMLKFKNERGILKYGGYQQTFPKGINGVLRGAAP